MIKRLLGREEKKPPKSITEVFARFARKAPGFKKGPYRAGPENMADMRPLSSDEKKRLFHILVSSGDEEARCAAAYVIGKLGLIEASSGLSTALANCSEDSHLRFTLLFAQQCLEIMKEYGTAPPAADQLPLLLEMRDSVHDGERRFAEIVLDKAGIKTGTVTGW